MTIAALPPCGTRGRLPVLSRHRDEHRISGCLAKADACGNRVLLSLGLHRVPELAMSSTGSLNSHAHDHDVEETAFRFAVVPKWLPLRLCQDRFAF